MNLQLIINKKEENNINNIYELLKRDKDFKNKFDSKYINSLIYMKTKTKVLDNAYDYLHEFSSKTFSKLYFSLVSRKKENDIKNKSFENFEDLEAALEERKYSYTKEREIYFMAYFWRKLYPNNKLIVNNSEIIDEFDEQRKYGLNTLERLKVNGISYDKFMEMQEQIIDDYNNENNDYIEKNEKNNVKKKVKRIKKQDSSQFSFFDKE